MKLFLFLITLSALCLSFTGATATGNAEVLNIAPRSETLARQIEQALIAKGADYRPRTEHLRADGSPEYTNRLILEGSPYLIQHAHNPIDWYPWGAEAFAAAKRENKPVFLSIGYSTCHWCHVMERESFEDLAIASLLNQHFIAVKVDRERRPDVDQTYMQAVYIIAGSGGWPMSSFLTPEGEPFFAGTYFPPENFHTLLLRVAELWSNQRDELIDRSKQIAEAMAQINEHRLVAGKLGDSAVFDAVNQALMRHDELQGGFGQAPKFPQEPLLFLLLAQSERIGDSDALAAVEVTLDAMSRGGIYDQVGGGFHRYSTDNDWLVPHFEKMLYNQAHLGRVYLLAWRLTGNPSYRRIATQTLEYVLRDMTSPEGAFYSATDADSEGEEGVFFLWTGEQLRQVLSEADAEFAIEIFGVTENGNFEDSNILYLPVPLEEIAQRHKLTTGELYERVDRIREQLYRVRETREHPLRDEKILTGWNGMMISTFAQAGMLFEEPRYTDAAVRAAQFIWDFNRAAAGELWRVHLDGSSSIAGQQEDYAYYAESLLHVYDATGNRRWLAMAEEVANGMLSRFWDEAGAFFYMSRDEAQFTALGRARDAGYDNAIPSGSSIALRVLQMLDTRVANFDYGKHANTILATFANAITRNPTNFGYMLTGASDLRNGELGAQQYVARGGVRATARRADTSQVVIDIRIPEGWHINSSQPLQKELIPTSIAIDSAGSGWRLGKVSYPEPVITTLGFQKEPLSVYDGDVRIRVEVSARDRQPAYILPIQLGIQACNDEICLPPEKVALHLPMHGN